MKYMVMECYPSYAVLLDENGRFFKAANLHYEIGQMIENPVLMKQTSLKEHRTIKWISSGIVAIAACFIIVFGFIYYQNYMATYSSIFLFLACQRPRSFLRGLWHFLVYSCSATLRPLFS